MAINIFSTIYRHVYLHKLCSRRKTWNIHLKKSFQRNHVQSKQQSHMTLRHKKLLNKLFLFFNIYLFHLSSVLFIYDNYRDIQNIIIASNSTQSGYMDKRQNILLHVCILVFRVDMLSIIVINAYKWVSIENSWNSNWLYSTFCCFSFFLYFNICLNII